MRLPPAPDGVSHSYFIYCSWPPVYSLFHVLKFKCGKHYQHPPWIIFFCCCCLGEKEGAFFFLFPFNFLCIVECIKWSKASFRLTKFKNYFLCSDAFVWKFIPVCTRQETRMWSSAHTLGLWAEELRRCGRPEYFREKRRKTVKALLAHRAAGCPTVVRELRYGCRWLCSHPCRSNTHKSGFWVFVLFVLERKFLRKGEDKIHIETDREILKNVIGSGLFHQISRHTLKL